MKNKKYLGLLGLGCGVLLLTGCGGKTLSGGKTLNCEMDMSDMLAGMGNMNAEIEIDYNSDGTEAEKATMTMTVEVTSDDVTDEMIDSLEESLQGECDTEDSRFDSCKVKRDGKKIVMTATGSADSIEGEIEEQTTLEDAKKALEDAGYTCE